MDRRPPGDQGLFLPLRHPWLCRISGREREEEEEREGRKEGGKKEGGRQSKRMLQP